MVRVVLGNARWFAWIASENGAMSVAATPTADLSFWQRQFGPDATFGQFVFDLTFGVVLPVICLVADPIVFRPGLTGAWVGHPIAGYLAIGIGIVSLLWWLFPRRLPAVSAGLLAGGALVAAGLGVILLPLTLIGLMAVIGVLGLVPFATAFVFARNAVRAFHTAGPRFWPGRWIAIEVGVCLSLALPLAADGFVTTQVTRAVEQVASADPDEAATAADVLRRYGPVANLDQLVWAYSRETDTARRDRLATAYWQITGKAIQDRLSRLVD